MIKLLSFIGYDLRKRLRKYFHMFFVQVLISQGSTCGPDVNELMLMADHWAPMPRSGLFLCHGS